MIQALLKKKWTIVTGLAITGLVMLMQLSRQPEIEKFRDRLDHILYDVRMQLTLPDEPDISEKIVVVDLDEKSLMEQGQWPWSRKKK